MTNGYAGSWSEVNQALVDENWGLADIHLDELANQRLSERAKFNLYLNQAWVKYKLGLTGEAKNVIANIRTLNYEPDELESLNLHDTILTVKYDHIKSLPSADKRVIIDTSNWANESSDYLYSALSATTWTKRKINEYLTIDTNTTPFLKPIAPKLIRDEFEKPENDPKY